MSDRGPSLLESVLHSPSIKEINELSPYAIKLAKRWAKEWPGKTRELEAAGKLLSALKQRAEVDSLREWRQRIRAVRATPKVDLPPGPEADSGPPSP
jgi:hypothetical protein